MTERLCAQDWLGLPAGRRARPGAGGEPALAGPATATRATARLRWRREVFVAPAALLAGAAAVGDPVAVLPVLFALL